MRRKPYYVSTPIYYVNDVPHIGHAYTTIAADAIARFKRLNGVDVFFLTGTDEHGQKIEKAAHEFGESPQELSDRLVRKYQHLWERLHISNSDFIRTTEDRHSQSVQKLFRDIEKRGDIYKGVYEDWYCIPCETFWTDLQLDRGRCPTCGRPVERLKEESYFFRMSKYQKRLLAFLKKNTSFIHPKGKRNEVIRFVEDGLKDLSISRRSFRWGIPVPSDPDHVIYVWFDALTNYLTAVGYGRDKHMFRRFWPADAHLIGKDILRFHAVFWPCFLLSAGIPLPRQISIHGWWTVDGEKMSKSKGNVVDPHALIDAYGADAFRYFLLREVPFGDDGDFSIPAMTQRYNSELANDLGNLISRSLSMIEQYTNGVIPAPAKTSTAADRALKSQLQSLYPKVTRHMTRWCFHQALHEIWKSIDLANQYVERNAPWNLAKEPKGQVRLATVLYHLAESIRILSFYLFPFMPKTAENIGVQLGLPRLFENTVLSKAARWGQLKPGLRVKKGRSLFPRWSKNPEDPKPETKLPAGPTKGGPIPLEPNLPEKTPVSIEDFRRLDLRVGRILSAESIPQTNRLLKLVVDLGFESRQVVAGIAERYRPQDLVGKSVILVANLKPVRIRGVESQGMILAAGDQEVLSVATFADSPPPGTIVK